MPHSNILLAIGAATLLMKASRSYEAKVGDASPPFATSACTAWRMGINFFSCFGVKFNCLTIRLQLLLLTGVLSLRLGCKRDKQTESQGEGSDSCGQISSWVLSLSLHFLRNECEFSFWLPTARHDYRISVLEARAVDHTALGGGTYVQNCSLWPKLPPGITLPQLTESCRIRTSCWRSERRPD